MPLKIAFISSSIRQTHQFFNWFVEDNREQVDFFDQRKGRVRLTDGTEISIVRTPYDMLRHPFDQILIGDDYRMNAVKLLENTELYQQLHRQASRSIVPQEFRVIYYIR